MGYETEQYYDEYDPSDIPEDQAAPHPECISKSDKDNRENVAFIQSGVPLCEEAKISYNYPVPKNPLTLPPRKKTRPSVTTTTKIPLPDCILFEESEIGPNLDYILQGVPLCPEEYDEYDLNDIPPDQAAPKEEGYSYQIPSNPLKLPTKLRKSKLFSGEEGKNGDDSKTSGLRNDKSDSFDPGNYDHNAEDYVDKVVLKNKNSKRRPKQLDNILEESALSEKGKVTSQHVPTTFGKKIQNLIRVGKNTNGRNKSSLNTSIHAGKPRSNKTRTNEKRNNGKSINQSKKKKKLNKPRNSLSPPKLQVPTTEQKHKNKQGSERKKNIENLPSLKISNKNKKGIAVKSVDLHIDSNAIKDITSKVANIEGKTATKKKKEKKSKLTKQR